MAEETAAFSLNAPTVHRHAKEKPVRARILPTPFDKEDLRIAYMELRDSYRKVSASDEGWMELSKRDGVEVSLLNHPTDPWCPYVRMKTVFPTSVENCWNFLQVANWDYSMPKMDPFYEGVEIYEKVNYKKFSFILCRKRLKRIFAFGKRDLVFLSVTEDKPLEHDGTWVSGTVSVETEQIPRKPGYTRAFQDSVGFYKPVKNNTHCEVTITCRIDLNDSAEGGAGGFIPMWLYVKTIGYNGVQSMIRMRQALINELMNRQQSNQKLLDPDVHE